MLVLIDIYNGLLADIENHPWNEAEHDATKPNAVWLDENEFWSKDD